MRVAPRVTREVNVASECSFRLIPKTAPDHRFAEVRYCQYTSDLFHFTTRYCAITLTDRVCVCVCVCACYVWVQKSNVLITDNFFLRLYVSNKCTKMSRTSKTLQRNSSHLPYTLRKFSTNLYVYVWHVVLCKCKLRVTPMQPLYTVHKIYLYSVLKRPRVIRDLESELICLEVCSSEHADRDILGNVRAAQITYGRYM